MRFCYAVLLATVAVLSSVHGLSSSFQQTKTAKVVSSDTIAPRSLTNHGRFLRTDTTAQDDEDSDHERDPAVDEERAAINVTPLVKAAWKVKFAIWKHVFRWDSHKVDQVLGVFKGPGLPMTHKNWKQANAYANYFGRGPLTYP
ncbi:hypothetical protein PHYBOEH_011104 [Phytophthora boehmeriae]|uniref:RxLR effector protein n=1 Tax=Phytophthora boehmeriae TaxID=109152 RepID=A0A8T1VM55_9STRA|nr:hypothetical protein PHYBOEH_011104 [Phytophthora boehmeriae]